MVFPHLVIELFGSFAVGPVIDDYLSNQPTYI